MAACQFGHIECARLLEEGEAHIFNSFHQTPLIIGAIYSHVEICKEFLPQAGIKDQMGCTALMHAVEQHNVEIVQLLSAVEARCKDALEQTALMRAVNLNYFDLVKILSKAEVREQDSQGVTALIMAISQERTEIA